jgi:hypothetical protein
MNIKEISKIKLEKDELLWITLDEGYYGEFSVDVSATIASSIPAHWHDRVVIGTDKIKLTKIVMEK